MDYERLMRIETAANAGQADPADVLALLKYVEQCRFTLARAKDAMPNSQRVDPDGLAWQALGQDERDEVTKVRTQIRAVIAWEDIDAPTATTRR